MSVRPAALVVMGEKQMKILMILAAVLLVHAGCSIEAAAQQSYKEQREAAQKQATTSRAQRTAEAIARISTSITPGHLAACTKQATQPGGASALITLKVNGPLVLSKPYTCLYTAPGLFDKSLAATAIYIAPASYLTLLGKPVNDRFVMCTFTLDGGKVHMNVGVAPTHGTSAQIQSCGFDNSPVARPAAKAAGGATAPKAASGKSSSGEGRSGNCPAYMKNGDTCTDAAGRTCTRTPEGRQCN